jgi:(R,R)-butanediol dehydrogenase/meso-butanediol dehydrogenase/diacetyl reductase
MEAIVYDGPGKGIAFREMDMPVPSSGQLLVKVNRCGICASDVRLSEGHPEMSYTPGQVIGHEFSGTVVALGPDTAQFALGDRIVCFPSQGCGVCDSCRQGMVLSCPAHDGVAGAFAPYSLAAAKGSFRLPDDVDFELGALVEPLAVGLHGWRRANVSPDMPILISGAGPIGLATCLAASQAGARNIAIVSRQEWRRPIAERMGATHFLTLGPDLADRACAALGSMPEAVFECIGRPGCLPDAISHVMPGGTVTCMGFGFEPEPIIPAAAAYKNVTLRFVLGYSFESFREAIELARARDGAARSLINRRIGLSEVPNAFAVLRGSAQLCKVMVEFDD